MMEQVARLMIVLAILGVCGISASRHREESSSPEVTIAQGTLRGAYKNSRAGKPFASFTKIPFGKPPVGELRFKAPEPAEAWTGIYDATQDVPRCIQKDFIFYRNPSIVGEEDCLYLNVYTPKNALPHKRSKLLPVMVYVPYGGNYAGNIAPGVVGPEFFMDKQVVWVSFNYRLAIFGFFSTLNDDSPGNYGPKDQVLALKWVQANIAKFGGDKNRVTILGQSSGGAATHHLMLSPLAKGLFHGVISESGAAVSAWAGPMNALQSETFPATGRFLGCDPSNTTELVACMRKLDANVVMNVQDNFKTFYREPLIIYTHVTEERSERNPEPFLERDPVEIIQSGNYQKVPWIVGTVQNEGAMLAAFNLLERKVREDFLEKFDEIVPNELLLSASIPQPDIPQFWATVKDYYMKGEALDITKPETVQRYIDMIGDRFLIYGSYKATLLHAMQGDQIWFYNFNFTGSRTYANPLFVTDAEDKTDIDLGISHCDELIYLLNSPDLFPDYNMSVTELKMSKVMVELWSNFAITGNPKSRQWQRVPKISGRSATNKNLYYLDIRGPDNLVLKNDYRRSNMQFWTDAKLRENVPEIV